jgi:hypothetical protein
MTSRRAELAEDLGVAHVPAAQESAELADEYEEIEEDRELAIEGHH